MKQDKDVFQIDLSRAELYWLAGALGIAGLPLPKGNPAEFSVSQLTAFQKEGQTSLLARNLIRPAPGFGWQADRLLVALLQWIESAPSLLRLEHITKDGTCRCVHLFTAEEQGLFLEMDDDIVHFEIYASLSSLQKAAMRWLTISTTTKAPISYALLQPLSLVPLVWKNRTFAVHILKEHNTDVETIPAILEWVATLGWIASLSQRPVNEPHDAPGRQYVLCGDGTWTWGGKDDGTKVSLNPITPSDIRAELSEMLKALG